VGEASSRECRSPPAENNDHPRVINRRTWGSWIHQDKRRFGDMRKQKGRTVYQRPDGSWAIKRNSAVRPSSVHATLLEAERFAREMLRNEGGGVLVTMGLNRKIRRCTVTG